MKVIWSIAARKDRRDLMDYIEADSFVAATAMNDRIDAAVDLLAEFPNSGRSGRVPGTRELVVSRSPYIAAYRVASDHVFILRLLHGAQEWPDQL